MTRDQYVKFVSDFHVAIEVCGNAAGVESFVEIPRYRAIRDALAAAGIPTQNGWLIRGLSDLGETGTAEQQETAVAIISLIMGHMEK